MRQARVYQPAKTAVSSGRSKTRFWIVELEPAQRKEPDRLMGWFGSGDTEQQVALKFPTKEAAIAYCEGRGFEYSVDEPKVREIIPKAYADNFIRKV